ncbi:MAG: thiamine pyrophosphate-dependent enzyme possible carboligase or decarboxylase [Frankiales bacterium]|nr:thiamine pyrophosphate-dependent enzyme possible carboligase or decarboxylase [Frankiales bacterium]
MSGVRVADYVAEYVATHGVSDVFMVTGGGAMHLNDALGNHPGLRVQPCHHEQACTIAAESYTRLTNRLCMVNVTTGPGGTNTITGLFGAWTDSVPLLVVSGQVKRETMVASTGLPLRQLGDQEVDIVSVVRPMTKYAAVVDDPSRIREHLDRAFAAALTGRPGPVWLDIPIDVQSSRVDPDELVGWEGSLEETADLLRGPELEAEVAALLAAVDGAERPVVLVGGGIRAAGCADELIALVERLQVPVVTAWNAHDLVWDDHPLYAGRPGTVGDRPGNFAVQNADLLVVLGSRLNIRQVGYAWGTFARGARVVMVDVDRAEMDKPTLHVDQPLHADLRDVLPALLAAAPQVDPAKRASWVAWCQERRRRYPAVLPEHEATADVNPYVFVDRLTRALPEGQVTVTGDGTACVVTFQAAVVKRGQRLWTNSGCASMGYDLPAAIGAATALRGASSVVCLAGDGSLMMNVQELATMRGANLDIKLFILNNAGYHSIRQTQNNYFPGREVGCGNESGLWFPKFSALAAAFELPFWRIEDHSQLDEVLPQVLGAAGPQVCEVVLDLGQQFAPKVSSRVLEDGRMVSAPLEDLAPFLSREELRENMLIPLIEQ